MPKKKACIHLHGVRQNNLKGFDLDLPIGELTVVTGLSGAGKSSLVFQTLHAEGQRRYVETFSPYTRQFMDLLDRPKVDRVDNIRPSIAIQQSNTVKTSRSTVGTITELCDYFKVWFANNATLYDPASGEMINDDNPQTIWKQLITGHAAAKRLIGFPIEKPKNLIWSEILQPLSAQGYTRVLLPKREGDSSEIARISDLLAPKPNPESRIPHPESRIPYPESRIPDPESRIPDPESRIPHPESRIPDHLSRIHVIQDRIAKIDDAARSRVIEALQTALQFGQGRVDIFEDTGRHLTGFRQGLRSPSTGQTFRPAIPALFSFNSPIGACPACRGFGRVIEIDAGLVVPDASLSIDDGAIRAFQGEVYSESLRDLQRAAKKHKIRTHIPWSKLNQRERDFVWHGAPDYSDGYREWYGIHRFFEWLNKNLYKMHVRVFLSKFRSYTLCPDCQGSRLQPESLNWKWQDHTLPDLYRKSISELLGLLKEGDCPQSPASDRAAAAGDNRPPNSTPPAPTNSALAGILSRLSFLEQVGLGYLTLDRSSRTLSGGETMRVNLTSCLGSSLVDTLFVLDEPSVGLHPRDMDRLIRILRRLTDLGNTVVVVEHDEAVMRAADHLIEIGPRPGTAGGQLTFSGDYVGILKSDTHTGRYLSGRETIEVPGQRRCEHRTSNVERPTSNKSKAKQKRSLGVQGSTSDVQRSNSPLLSIYAASKHNVHDLTLHLPLQRLVCLSGVSGSGKSTLLNNIIYQNLLAQKGLSVDEPAALKDIECTLPLSDVVFVDQSPVSKTPRSNPASYSKAWEAIRQLFARLDEAQAAGMGAGHFSFNGGDGRCPTCSGLGYERIEMQFVSDLFVPCESCEGQRFKPEVLDIEFNGRSIAQILDLDITEACLFFGDYPKITRCLQPLVDVGLGYLKLGQPLNTLSGGESQRLKLVRYLGRVGTRPSHENKPASSKPSASRRVKGSASSGSTPNPGTHALILIDEPTTGLHRADVKRLIGVLQSLVDAGNSVIVIEHNLDVLKVADWIVEMGPEAGSGGGRITAQGTPEQIAQAPCVTAPYLREALDYAPLADTEALQAAEPPAAYAQTSQSQARPAQQPHSLVVEGAREHNLRNISCSIPHNKTTVITGASGSGKSTLAFDIIFAEGQRRFMESMSAYARQFVEQMPRAEVDSLHGIAPTVAIEQRVTKGTRKSTVATITEVAQYLRLLYARIGIQHSPTSGEAVVTQTEDVLLKRLQQLCSDYQGKAAKPSFATLYLCAPLIRGRKGHHEPLANWARDHGYEQLRIDGRLIHLKDFKKLNRYAEHDIDLVVASLEKAAPPNRRDLQDHLATALKLGKGSAFLMAPNGDTLSRLSTKRTDPITGEAFPELDPKHFSWNSPRGWCPTCRGYGQLFDWMAQEEESTVDHLDDYEDGATCPDCQGARLNELSRNVRLPLVEQRTSNSKHSTSNKAKSPNKPTFGKQPHSTFDFQSFTLDGPQSVSLNELLRLTPSQLLQVLNCVKTDKRSETVLAELMPEIEERMRFMDRVGLDYLSLDRATATLSGGEAQRIRLAAQLGSNLSGVLYVLDEPSIGLHARDNAKLLDSLKQLRQRGNTLVIVEHNEATMRQADHIIDLGPGAGIHGGEIVASGKIGQIKKSKRSLTGKYLRKKMQHPLRGAHRPLPTPWSPRKKKSNSEWIALQGAALRNLKGFDLQIPKQRLTVVCGISGAGKSTLIRDLLRPLVQHAIECKKPKLTPKDLVANERRTSNAQRSTSNQNPIQSSMFGVERSTFRSLANAESIRRVIEVDQSPIGKTPRSTPATYIGAFDIIRQIYAQLPEANIRGFSAGTFSFNTKGGRCETCKGAGRVKLEMNFMPDTYVTCEDCHGRRYDAELDDLRWHGKSIADVLQMSFEEAAAFFSFHTQLSSLMLLMVETGLGYIKLGQYSPTLSGGEAQRLKLVSELAKGLPSFKERQYNKGEGNLYLLEEPSIGLHLSDVERLTELLHRLVDRGHTVLVIEHHLEIIKDADYVIEIGPEGGEAGGSLLYQGDLAGIKACPESVTAAFL